MSDTLMVLLEIFGKACMFYNVRLFLYTKLHVEMCLINFGIRYECKIGVRFVKEFNDTIRQNPFCRRILILKHKLWRRRSIKMRILIKKGFHHILHAFFSFFCQFSLFFWIVCSSVIFGMDFDWLFHHCVQQNSSY